MADKKIDKKAAKEAEVVSNLPLPEQLVKKREELLMARQGLGSTLQNPHRIKVIKKDIARIMTKINASRGVK
jgi:ribosomal protein L29